MIVGGVLFGGGRLFGGEGEGEIVLFRAPSKRFVTGTGAYLPAVGQGFLSQCQGCNNLALASLNNMFPTRK